jgi:hypothetical protein
MGTAAPGAATAAGSPATYQVGPITDVSTCSGQNAEVEQAVDAKRGYVYQEWMGCRGIAVARSTDGECTWGAPVSFGRSGRFSRVVDSVVLSRRVYRLAHWPFMIAAGGWVRNERVL